MPVPVKMSEPGVVWPMTVGVLSNVTPPELAGWCPLKASAGRERDGQPERNVGAQRRERAEQELAVDLGDLMVVVQVEARGS